MGEYVWQIKAQSVVLGDIEPPAWLADAQGSQWPTPKFWSSKQDRPLAYAVCGRGGMRPGHSGIVRPHGAGFNFVDANCPPPARWLQLLKEFWPDDDESIEALQLWFGYCLVADTRQHKLLLLIGPKRTGKGTIATGVAAAGGGRERSGPHPQ